jgi:hypothetical protein
MGKVDAGTSCPAQGKAGSRASGHRVMRIAAAGIALGLAGLYLAASVPADPSVRATSLAEPLFSPRAEAACAELDGWLYCVGGRVPVANANPFTNDVWRSRDGAHWVAENLDPPFSPRAGARALAFSGALYLAGGRDLETSESASIQELWRRAESGAEPSWEQVALPLRDSGATSLSAWVKDGWLIVAQAAPGGACALWKSRDGLDWLGPLTPSLPTPRVTWEAGGRLFAMADAAQGAGLWSSPDGLTWSQVPGARPPSLDSEPIAVSRGGKPVLYGLGEKGAWESENGIDWRAAAAPSEGKGPLRRATLATLAGKAIALGGEYEEASKGEAYGVSTSVLSLEGANTVWASEDLRAWKRLAGSRGPAGYSATGPARWGQGLVSLGGRLYFLGGAYAFSTFSDTWVLDGAGSWALASRGIELPRRCYAGAAAFKGRIYLAAGLDSSNPTSPAPRRDIWSSADGKEWRLESESPGFSPRIAPSLQAMGGSLWLYGGIAGPIGQGKASTEVWKSEDGRRWSLVSSSLPARPYATGACFNGRLWLFGGFLPVSGFPCAEAYSSADGVTWRREAELPFEGYGIPAAAGPGKDGRESLCLVDGSLDLPFFFVYWSKDGVRWSYSRVDCPAGRPGPFAALCAHGGAFYLSGGRDDAEGFVSGGLWRLELP